MNDDIILLQPEPPRETGPQGPPEFWDSPSPIGPGPVDADVSDLSDPFDTHGLPPAPGPYVPPRPLEEIRPLRPTFDGPLDYESGGFLPPAGIIHRAVEAYEPAGVAWHFAPRGYDPEKGTWTASAGGFHGASGKSQREAVEELREEAAGGVKKYRPFGEEKGVTLDQAAALTACALEFGRLDVEGEPVDAAAWVAGRVV